MLRMVDDHELEARLQDVLDAESDLQRVKGRADLRRFLRGRPEVCFVSATGAAAILKIPAPHISRLRKKDRLPIPILVEGGYPVYVRSEVESLAREIAAERAARRR